MLGFHKRKWRPEGADIYEELARTDPELMGGDRGMGGGQQEQQQKMVCVCEW